MLFTSLSLTMGFAQDYEHKETFDNATELLDNVNGPYQYDSGSFEGNEQITWNYVHARNESDDQGDYSIDGDGILLRGVDVSANGNPPETSSLSATIEGGIANFKVDTRKAFSGNKARVLELLINEEVIETFEPNFNDGEDTTVHSFIVDNINIEGTFVLMLRSAGEETGNMHIVLDNLQWDSYTVCDIEAPSGETVQTIDEGQTLADLIISGEEDAVYTWYTDEDLQNEIDNNTTLEVGEAVTYYVTQTVGDCVSEPLAVTVTVLAGIDTIDQQAFKVYPNPVKDSLNISYKENIQEVTVINMLGQIIYSKTVNATETQIDMNSLASGNYLVKVIINSAVHTVKITK